VILPKIVTGRRRALLAVSAAIVVLGAVGIGASLSVRSDTVGPAPPPIPIRYTLAVSGRTFQGFGTSSPERLGAIVPVELTVKIPEGFRLECLVLAPLPNPNGESEALWTHCPNVDRLTRPLLLLDQGLPAGTHSYDLTYKVEYSYEYETGQTRRVTTADPILQLMWQATVTNPAEADQYDSGAYSSLPIVTIPVVPPPGRTV
jgi:hypothetical protein